MITHDDLNAYRWAVLQIQALDEHIQKVESAVERATPLPIPADIGIRIASSKSDKDRLIIYLIEMREEFERNVKELMELQKRVHEAINTLPPRERTLMMLRFESGNSWEEVASKMGYTVEHIRGKIYPKALEMLFCA